MSRCSSTTPTSPSARAVGGASRSCSGPRGRGRRATSPGSLGAVRPAGSAGAAGRPTRSSRSPGDRPTSCIARRLRPGEDPSPLPNGVPVPDRPLAAPARLAGRARARRSSAGSRPRRGSTPWSTPGPLVREPRIPSARLTLIGEGPERPAPGGAGSRRLGPGRRGRAARGARPTRPRALRDGRPVRPPLARGGDEHRPARGDGPGHPAGRLGDPRQPPLLVDDFKHGRLAPPDDPAALARAILDQWADFDRAFHMGRAARGRVEQEFSIAAVARKHLELFRDVDRAGDRRRAFVRSATSCSRSCN